MNIDLMRELEESNKPKEILEKIVEWKKKKYYSEIVLLEQTYIRDDSKKIKEILGKEFEVVWYKRFWI
jgi:elongation factor Ts